MTSGKKRGYSHGKARDDDRPRFRSHDGFWFRPSRKHGLHGETNALLETRQTIINNIHGHIKGRGGRYKEWRIGVCAGADCGKLDIPNAGDSLLFQTARSPDDATAIMAYFVYIYDVVRDKRDLNIEDCDVVYLYKPMPE